MRLFSFSLALAVLLAPSSSMIISPKNSTAAAQNATVAALVYGIPLTPYAMFANTIARNTGSWATNTLQHSTTLSNASTRIIILPNVDTLYSAGLLDLSGGDLVTTMPTLEPGRFYVWPFYDIYGDNFCNIGTTTNSTAGKYLITYRPSNPGCTAGSGGYEGIIYMPTVYGATLLRIEVANQSDVDYVVASIQPTFSLTALPSDSAPCAPPLTQALLNNNLTTSNMPFYIMQLTARIAAYNLPEVASDVASVTATLKTAGISLANDSYTTPSGVNLTGVVENPTDFVSLGGGWVGIAPELCGDFLSHYDVRALVAVQAYLQLQANEALYPTFEISGDLYANQTYMLEFSGKPQVTGFWSLTMYGGDGFLDSVCWRSHPSRRCFDGRMDYSALFHGHSTTMANVLDLQVVDVASRAMYGEGAENQLARLSPYFAAIEVASNRAQYSKLHKLISLGNAMKQHAIRDARPGGVNDVYSISLLFDHFIRQGYINPSLSACSLKYVRLWSDSPPSSTDVYRSHPIKPLEIFESSPHESAASKCTGCRRTLGRSSFPSTSQSRCFVCTAISARTERGGEYRTTSMDLDYFDLNDDDYGHDDFDLFEEADDWDDYPETGRDFDWDGNSE
ncbi:hypothetical protein DFH09DRAFT_1304550 [Mycena vulgaris]|nr:hypothetical protein DFH09DRAFT_1304550 [Mycena vulgaris]